MSAWGNTQTGGSSRWGGPTPENTPWRAPGHDRMFHDDDAEDNPNRSFTTRKKHGWWGKEERYDLNGNRID